MKRKILSMLLVFCIMLTMLPASVFAEDSGNSGTGISSTGSTIGGSSTGVIAKSPKALLGAAPSTGDELNAALYAASSEFKPLAAYSGSSNSFAVDSVYGGVSVQNIQAGGGEVIIAYQINVPVSDDAWYKFSFDEFISTGNQQTAYGGYFVNAPADGWKKAWCGYGGSLGELYPKTQYTYNDVSAQSHDHNGTNYSSGPINIKGGYISLPYIMQPNGGADMSQNNGDYNKFKVKNVTLTKLRNQTTVSTASGTGSGKVDVAVAGEESLNKTNVDLFTANVGRGSKVTLTAHTTAGSCFDHWVAPDGSDLGRDTVITVTTAANASDESNKEYKAVFKKGEDSRVGLIRDNNSRNDLLSDDIQITHMGGAWSEDTSFNSLKSYADNFYHKLGSSDAQLALNINVKNSNSALYGLLTDGYLDSVASTITTDVPFKITVDGVPTNAVLKTGESHSAFYIDGLSAGSHTVIIEPTVEDSSVFLRTVGVVSGTNKNITLKAADFEAIAGCESYTVLVNGVDVTDSVKSTAGATVPYGSVVKLAAKNADITKYGFKEWNIGTYSDSKLINVADTDNAVNRAFLIARGNITLTPVYTEALDINSAILLTPGEKDPAGNDYYWQMNDSSKFSVDSDGHVAIREGGELTLYLTIPDGKTYVLNNDKEDIIKNSVKMTLDSNGYWNAKLTDLTPYYEYRLAIVYTSQSGVICQLDSVYPNRALWIFDGAGTGRILTSKENLKLAETPTVNLVYGDLTKNGTLIGGRVISAVTGKEVPGTWSSNDNSKPAWGSAAAATFTYTSDPVGGRSIYTSLYDLQLPIVLKPKPVNAVISGTPTAEYGSDGKTTANFIIPTSELVNASDAISVTAQVTLPTGVVGSYIDVTSIGAINKSGALAAAYEVTLPDNITGTVTPKNVTKTISEAYSTNSYYGIGEFTSPVFDGVGDEKITGIFRYTYGNITNGTYDQVIKEVAKNAVGSKVNIDYLFTASGNYTGTITGKIAITMQLPPVNAEADALTIKTQPVYGDSWYNIFTRDNSKITVDGKKFTGTCSVKIGEEIVDDIKKPNQGSYNYQILFSSDDEVFKNLPVTGLSGTVTVGKKALADEMLAITGSYTYTGSKIEPAFTVTDGIPSLIKSSDYAVTYSDNTNAGTDTCSVTITAADGGNYSGTISKTFSIVPKAVTAVITAEKVYDGTLDADNALKFQIPGILSQDTVTYTTSGSKYNDANVGSNHTVTIGTYIKTGEGSQNYNVTVPITVQNCIISKRPVTVTVDVNQGKLYGQNEPDTLTYTTSGIVGSEKLAGALTRAAGETVGSYTVQRGTLTDEANPNYGIKFNNNNKFGIKAANVILNVTIAPTSQKVNKDVTITVSAQNDGLNLMNSGWSLPAGISLTGPDGKIELTPVAEHPGNYTATYHTPAAVPSTAQVSFTASVNDSSGNYKNPINKTADLTITEKSPVTVTVTPDKKTGLIYGDIVTYTAAIAKADLSDPDELTGTVQFYLDGKGNINKIGEPQSITGEMKVTLNYKQLTAGSHTVYAIYSGNDYFAESNTSVTADIAQKELVWDTTNLTVEKRADGKTDAAQVQGKLKIAGVLENDTVKFDYIGITAPTFTTAEPHSEALILTLDGAAISGAQAANYKLPSTLNVTGTIYTVIYRPKPIGKPGLSTLPDSLKNAGFNTPAEIEKALIGILSKNSAYSSDNTIVYDITPEISGDNGSNWQNTNDDNFPNGLLITLPYPDRTGRNTHDFAVTHMFTTANNGHKPGDTEEPAVTKTDKGIEFTVNSLSPIALGWKTIHNSDDSSSESSLGSSYREDEYGFWQTVEKWIEDANSGDTIKINARSYDKMPWTVMNLLQKHDDVTFVITWDGGSTITIPAGKAIKPELERIYYPLSYLAGYNFGDKTVASDLSKLNPKTGRMVEITAPLVTDNVVTNGSKPQITGAQRGLAESPDLAKKGVEKAITGVFKPETADPKAKSGIYGLLITAILALAAAAAGGAWFLKKRNINK